MTTLPTFNEAERALVATGRKFDAIKALRYRTGLGLSEAKAVLDLEFPPAPGSTPAERMEQRALEIRRRAGNVLPQAAVFRVASRLYSRAAQAFREERGGDGSSLVAAAETLLRYAEEIQREAEHPR